MKLRSIAAAVLCAVAASGAHAESFLDIVNRSGSFITTGANDVLGAGIAFTVGSLRLNLDPGTRAFITYVFEGKEAGYTNQLVGPGRSWTMSNAVSFGTSLTTQADAGLLDFGFRANTGASSSTPVFHNGANHIEQHVNWGVLLDGSRLSGRLLLDDGGAGPDADYDDMVVRFNVSIQPVPEASTVAMMLAGLGLLGFTAWRKRKTL